MILYAYANGMSGWNCAELRIRSMEMAMGDAYVLWLPYCVSLIFQWIFSFVLLFVNATWISSGGHGNGNNLIPYLMRKKHFIDLVLENRVTINKIDDKERFCLLSIVFFYCARWVVSQLLWKQVYTKEETHSRTLTHSSQCEHNHWENAVSARTIEKHKSGTYPTTPILYITWQKINYNVSWNVPYQFSIVLLLQCKWTKAKCGKILHWNFPYSWRLFHLLQLCAFFRSSTLLQRKRH